MQKSSVDLPISTCHPKMERRLLVFQGMIWGEEDRDPGVFKNGFKGSTQPSWVRVQYW
jgi:hypothetical protein